MSRRSSRHPSAAPIPCRFSPTLARRVAYKEAHSAQLACFRVVLPVNPADRNFPALQDSGLLRTRRPNWLAQAFLNSRKPPSKSCSRMALSISAPTPPWTEESCRSTVCCTTHSVRKARNTAPLYCLRRAKVTCPSYFPSALQIPLFPARYSRGFDKSNDSWTNQPERNLRLLAAGSRCRTRGGHFVKPIHRPQATTKIHSSRPKAPAIFAGMGMRGPRSQFPTLRYVRHSKYAAFRPTSSRKTIFIRKGRL